MLRYLDRTQIKSQILKPKQSISLKEKVWLDLLEPTKTEKALVEKQLGIKIPTREDMREIELSSRLYHKKGAYFMTVTMLNQSDSSNPTLDPVTFILTDQQLITIRYIEPQAFNLFNLHAEKLKSQHRNPISLLIELLDAAVERLADTLELVGHRLDDYSDTIFRKEVRTKKHDYKQLMLQIGPIGDLNTQTQESLITFNRVLTYLMQAVGSKLNKKKQVHIDAMAKDIRSLGDHANFLSGKINFLLDATLGLVNIEQNNIIKILSVAAVIFLPPTLLASIYGMNFHHMPELSWKYGYHFTLILEAASAWLPYKYFKYRKWL
ncbi:MAG: magnesium transporter CorA family protein [Gammaproteobacteria bacterium]|nr:magnesium transporter CorA family protein [Gammaproteobacteria bacterium]